MCKEGFEIMLCVQHYAVDSSSWKPQYEISTVWHDNSVKGFWALWDNIYEYVCLLFRFPRNF
jgi:hypothetical protein